MPRDLLGLPDDVLLMVMSSAGIPELKSLRATHSRFNSLFVTYPRQICDHIIEAHFCDPYLPHHFQELTDQELRYWRLKSRFEGDPYHVRQLRRFDAVSEYVEGVEDILHFINKPPKIRLQHFSIKGRPRPTMETRRRVLLYFTMLFHHNARDLDFLHLYRYWPSNIPHYASQQWEDAVTWVEMVLMYKIWQTVSADVSICTWNHPGEIFPLLRTFVRHTHPEEIGEVVNICSLGWSSPVDRQVLSKFRVKMLPLGDVCETWTRLYKGTVHDRNIL